MALMQTALTTFRLEHVPSNSVTMRAEPRFDGSAVCFFLALRKPRSATKRRPQAPVEYV